MSQTFSDPDVPPMDLLPPDHGGAADEPPRRTLGLLIFALFAPLLLLVAMLLMDGWMGAPGFTRDYVVRFDLPPPGAMAALPEIAGPNDPRSPLVVIDAGHGGHDPGAHGEHAAEKDLTLSLALALRQRLLEVGGIRVAMTRTDDRYLLLEERSGIARRLKADLFISIHADSADTPGAHGATVYTLSDRGSSQEAEHLAASENRADTVNGVSLANTSSSVSAILVDLSQRHAAEMSTGFARLILREGQAGEGEGGDGRARIDFRERAIQSAAFVVLKAPDVPSVLYEAGYISNADDAARLSSPGGRRDFAHATAQAIRVYFARQRETPIEGEAAGQNETPAPAQTPIPGETLGALAAP
ncbi:N-acetylmuramoyl-L-alanine amidase family protein [Novosphingobium sp. KACC 22771]|uniref:N-acetylmuramoyl-L-alanine amidase family protein n=1 Tax=Novosphingobium sp. KACC 22771 TaxID=3025670 RepID=UPI00236550CB|nr:N-acetylmuramoyl-L-alanine amidase [Novosphingobium sp. KACC 22771]WDF71860.1 N-acetylmuramoyl-L-alanine amidase [Novosphingobium sp. KACC 22771]